MIKRQIKFNEFIRIDNIKTEQWTNRKALGLHKINNELNYLEEQYY